MLLRRPNERLKTHLALGRTLRSPAKAPLYKAQKHHSGFWKLEQIPWKLSEPARKLPRISWKLPEPAWKNLEASEKLLEGLESCKTQCSCNLKFIGNSWKLTGSSCEFAGSSWKFTGSSYEFHLEVESFREVSGRFQCIFPASRL